MRIEEYVGEDNAVRAVGVYVENPDLERLEFSNASGELTAGQPVYPPGNLLKLYPYYFLQGIRSRRKLAQECRWNWMVRSLRVHHKNTLSSEGFSRVEYRNEIIEQFPSMYT
jgi:transposase